MSFDRLEPSNFYTHPFSSIFVLKEAPTTDGGHGLTPRYLL